MRLVTIGLGLAVALAIVIGAWYVGGREGFQSIGRGGENLRLLPRVGQMAPDFTAHDLNGRTVRLSDYQGKAVWLNFWGSWCPPCRAEMPDIETAYQRLAPSGLTLLAISLNESPKDAADFAALNHATFTVLSDPTGQDTGRAYPIFNFPTHIFIDKNGVVRAVILASMDVDTAVKNGEAVLHAT